MGDEGAGVGSAVLSLINNGEDLSKIKSISMPYLGNSYTDDETLQILKSYEHKIKGVDKFIGYGLYSLVIHAIKNTSIANI